MKLKTIPKSYDEVAAMPKPKHRKPIRPNMFFRTLLRAVSIPDLAATDFTCTKIGMERLGKKEPCLYLMNHCSFIDLEIAATILYPRPFNIICTSDGFVGKDWLMHAIGCIPTNKFTSDLHLLRDMTHAVKKLGNSVLMYPEASYSFDGTSTPLPETLGGCLKLLGIPVVMIRTFGSFSRNPLYNNLKRRKVKVSAEMEYILSPEEIQEKTPEELNAILKQNFTFDYWSWQRENGVKITEDFRAEGLNRVLYKCPHCQAEGKMSAAGISVTCEACGKTYELTEDGTLEAKDGEGAFTHVPDWYAWERECVRNEILEGKYHLQIPVDICMLMDTKHVYRVGEGELTHTKEGFRLVGCEGKLDYTQKAISSYSLYSDFYWYEIGDVICIGDSKMLYYCFPKCEGDFVAKTRLAAEEIYKIAKEEKGKKKR
ncbi:MAG: 1-acyl-sn-glycerol-3-phosphate acyltransferase [Clostridia bacterium]|nr:1-acyl-sn-glycerol-3-phosphate acyltransferase [Clostridia bacterium]